MSKFEGARRLGTAVGTAWRVFRTALKKEHKKTLPAIRVCIFHIRGHTWFLGRIYSAADGTRMVEVPIDRTLYGAFGVLSHTYLGDIPLLFSAPISALNGDSISYPIESVFSPPPKLQAALARAFPYKYTT